MLMIWWAFPFTLAAGLVAAAIAWVVGEAIVCACRRGADSKDKS